MEGHLPNALIELVRGHDATSTDEGSWAAFGRSALQHLLPLVAPAQTSRPLPQLKAWLKEPIPGSQVARCTAAQAEGVCELVGTLPQLAALLKHGHGVLTPQKQYGWRQRARWTALQREADTYLKDNGLDGLPMPLALTSEVAFRHWLSDLHLAPAHQLAVRAVARTVVELVALTENDLANAIPAPVDWREPVSAPASNWGIRALVAKARSAVRAADGTSANEFDAAVDSRRFKEHEWGSPEHTGAWLSARGFTESQTRQVQGVAPDLASLMRLDASQLEIIGLQATPYEPLPSPLLSALPRPTSYHGACCTAARCATTANSCSRRHQIEAGATINSATTSGRPNRDAKPASADQCGEGACTGRGGAG